MSATVSAWALAGGALALAAQQLRARAVWLARVRRACHELRGPITAARLGLELGAATGELSPARLRALDLELGRAGLALDELSGAGGGGAGAPRGQAGLVDAAALVEQSVSAWQGCAQLHGAKLTARWTGPRVAVRGERLRLAQVFGNLLANAIEHGAGPIELAGEAAAGTVRIEVLDGGPGLPTAIRAQLGVPMARRRRTARGPLHGHGLAIAATIVRDHGGRLAAADTPGGACVVVDLPVAA